MSPTPVQTAAVKSIAQPPVAASKATPRIVGALFLNSCSFAGESFGVTIGRNVESITPVMIDDDGLPVPSAQSHGLLLTKKVAGVPRWGFVAWANVKELIYGELP